jgi:hypothetical protein
MLTFKAVGSMTPADIGAVAKAGDTMTGNLTLQSNLVFDGNARRITGDFSNTTPANRVMFQTSTANGLTVPQAIPNGTGLIAGWGANSDSTTSNGSTVSMVLRGEAGEARFSSDRTGTGTYLPMTFYTGGSERMRVDTSGNVGIGTSSPASRLSVTGTSSGVATDINYSGGIATGAEYSALRFTASAQGFVGSEIRGINTNGGTNLGVMAMYTSGTERARIDSSGNVGIGATSVDGSLHIAKNNALLHLEDPRTTGDGSHTVSISAYKAFAGYNNLVVEGASLRFNTIGTERARIDSSGALLVGTTTKLSEKLDVRGTALGNDTALIQNDNSTTFAASVLTLGATRTTTNSTFNFLTCVTQGVAFRLIIRDSGNVVNQNNSYGAISDIKLKENIVDATPKLAKLNQVRVVNYNLIGEGQKQLGVIAQELEQVFPGMVEESPDRDAEGNDLGTTTKAVKYSVFVPMLIKAMQEQQQMIETLQAKVAALENA